MAGGRYVLLVWSCASLVPWGAIYVGWPAARRALVWSSGFALPFGFSEVLFAGRYWAPPSLFDLAARVHLDLESFVFLFATGGLAALAYHVATGAPVVVEPPPAATCSAPRRNAAFATPGIVFAVALVAARSVIVAGLVAMLAGAAARVWVRRDLARKVWLGAAVFAAYYAVLIGSLAWLEPGYIAAFWYHPGPRVLGVPIVELAYGACFGAYWSGLYEQYRWTFFHRC